MMTSRGVLILNNLSIATNFHSNQASAPGRFRAGSLLKGYIPQRERNVRFTSPSRTPLLLGERHHFEQ
jgi:hypothetical protein